MTRYIAIATIILLFFGLCVTPGSVNSADPRMEDVFREQRNDVHSLAANAYNTLRYSDDESFNVFSQEMLDYTYDEFVKYGDFTSSRWETLYNKDSIYNNLINIKRAINVQSFRSCRILITKDISNNKAYYSPSGERISKDEADEVIEDITEKASRETGFIDSISKIDFDNPSEESIRRMQDLEYEVDHEIKNDPNYPAIIPIVKYVVQLIPNDKHYVIFDIRDNSKKFGYTSFFVLKEFGTEHWEMEGYGE